MHAALPPISRAGYSPANLKKHMTAAQMYMRNLTLDENQQIWLGPSAAYEAMAYYLSVKVSAAQSLGCRYHSCDTFSSCASGNKTMQRCERQPGYHCLLCWQCLTASHAAAAAAAATAATAAATHLQGPACCTSARKARPLASAMKCCLFVSVGW